MLTAHGECALRPLPLRQFDPVEVVEEEIVIEEVETKEPFAAFGKPLVKVR